MKLFILENCPHCKRARKWLEELYSENPSYQTIEIEVIDEQVDEALASQYDYYYVPTIFDGDKKLHEGVATKEGIRNILDEKLTRL